MYILKNALRNTSRSLGRNILIGIIVIKLFINVLRRVLNKTKVEKFSASFFVGLLKFMLYLVLILILLSIIGVNIGGVLTALSAAVLAIGIALQNIIANVANGLVIVTAKMFKKGDYITVNGISGSVVKINFLFTTLQTPDNKRITVPNSTIVNNCVIDNDVNKTRRVEIKFEVAYESDVEFVKKVVLDAVLSNGKVLLDPAPTCRLSELKTSGIEFTTRFWVDREDYWNVYYDLNELIFNEIKKNKISIPYNQLEIRERKDSVVMPFDPSPLPQRVEKQREEKVDLLDIENLDIKKAIEINKKKKESKKKQIKEKTAEKAVETKK